ncbi:MAG: hypothetical protein OER21_01110 [Gemmatimonadota bacterium]|nr:hypothetical protein [Gemmatimonadota bacterium]
MPRHAGSVLVSVALVLSASACRDDAAPRPRPVIDSLEVDNAALPDVFDSLRTFRYRFPTVQADSVLLALLVWEVDVRRAWRPISILCASPMGPRFTIELGRDDPRVLGFGFERGEGGLGCAWRLMRYDVRRPN